MSRASADPPATAERPVDLSGTNTGYRYIFAAIDDLIRTGGWRPEQQIPGERELSKTYGVSRGTVRQALDKAVQHGLLVRLPGRGTFVNKPRIRQDLGELRTFRSTIAQHALRPAQRLLRSAWELAPELVAAALEVPPAAPLFCVDILGLANEKPVSFYHSYIREPAATPVARALPNDETPYSTYELVGQALGVPELVAEQTFEAIALNAEDAALLEAAEGAPAFRVFTLVRMCDGTPIEWRTALYPGAIYTFNIGRSIRFG
jgi:GntR family transcriptional regulator